MVVDHKKGGIYWESHYRKKNSRKKKVMDLKGKNVIHSSAIDKNGKKKRLFLFNKINCFQLKNIFSIKKTAANF